MLKAGESVDRYVIDSLIGQGGMGEVYRAHDPRLDRDVALKVVRFAKDDAGAAREEATARLLREARAAAKLDHPNAIAIYDVGETGGTAFIAMELVDGATMRARIDAGTLTGAERLRVLADVARALAAAHRARIVHRDVKPENVMLRQRDGMVKVLDFGIARRAAHELDPSGPTEASALLTLTAQGVPIGTPVYMAPEQIKGDPLDGRSDQFAWGVVAWEAFTGKLPWTNKSDAMALAGAILTQKVPRVATVDPSVDTAIDEVIQRTLQKAPEDRFASMDDVVAALEAAGAVSTPRPSGDRTREKPASKPAPRSGPPPALPALNRYSTERAKAILSRALERQAEEQARGERGYGADDILEAAREMGVDKETLKAAEREVEERLEHQEDEGTRRTREIRKLIRHLGSYLAVNIMLWVTINWQVAKWVVFGWGIGVVAHAAKVFFPDPAPKKKKEEKRKRKDRERPRDEEVERVANELLSTIAARRVRIAPVAPIAGDVDAEAEAELLAEREAASEPKKRERAAKV